MYEYILGLALTAAVVLLGATNVRLREARARIREQERRLVPPGMIVATIADIEETVRLEVLKVSHPGYRKGSARDWREYLTEEAGIYHLTGAPSHLWDDMRQGMEDV